MYFAMHSGTWTTFTADLLLWILAAVVAWIVFNGIFFGTVI
jgi:hypothetical protein